MRALMTAALLVALLGSFAPCAVAQENYSHRMEAGTDQTNSIVISYGRIFGKDRRSWVAAEVGERSAAVTVQRGLVRNRWVALYPELGVEARERFKGRVRQVGPGTLVFESVMDDIVVRGFVGLHIEARHPWLGPLKIALTGRAFVQRPDRVREWTILEGLSWKF